MCNQDIHSYVNVFVDMTLWACVYVCECEEECVKRIERHRCCYSEWDDETEEEANTQSKQLNGKEINERLVSMVKCRFLIFAYVFFLFCFVSFVTTITSVYFFDVSVCVRVCGLAGSLDCPASILVCAVHRDWIDWIAQRARF